LKVTATIFIIGINPYILLPEKVLNNIFTEAGKNKGSIPVILTINNKEYHQNLVKYSGSWRLYLNTPMRKEAGKEVGDKITIDIRFDATERITPMHPQLNSALEENKKAKAIYDLLPPSRKKEIMRYINNLKTKESVERNITKAIQFLLGNERFIGRDNP
jgi:uncharacterized protein YdeI (YjbR/CyaY-like superfamily)